MRRGSVIAVLTGMGVLLGFLGSVAINAATSTFETWPSWLQPIQRHPFEASVALGVVAALVAMTVTVSQERPSSQSTRVTAVPQGVFRAEWHVDRPAEIEVVVRELLRMGANVGLTTTLQGAGGFGKTTLAGMICSDRRVLRHFRRRICWITIGRDVTSRSSIASKVDDLIRILTGQPSGFDDPFLAGQQLGRILDAGPRMLVVIDDVWTSEQLAPFLIGGRRCCRLVTTRVRSTFAVPGIKTVVVDEMSEQQAKQVLAFDLPTLSEDAVRSLLEVTGRWPILLRLVNRAIVHMAETGLDAPAAASRVLERLREVGPTAVDDQGHLPSVELNIPEQRARAVRATIEASTGMLPELGSLRLAELGIFAEDELIPVPLVLMLWHATAGIEEFQGRELVRRLAELSLIRLSQADSGLVSLHDVVRDYLRTQLGRVKLTEVNAALISVLQARLPSATPLPRVSPTPRTAWWSMSSDDRYLWDHVITHIIESGSPSEATATASDPRWVVERLLRSGLAGPASDLAVVGSARGAALRTTLLRAGHLLRPSDSPNTLVNTFVGRLYDDTRLRNVAAAFESLRTGPLIKPRWPLPDQLQRTLLQILTDHTGPVKAVTMSLDGKIVATAQGNRLRIFSTLTGVLQTTFGGHKSAITSALMLPQATSLVTTQRGLITIWDIASGGIKAQVRCRNNPGTLAVSAGRGRLFWAVGRNVYSWSGDTTADCTKVARLGGTISALAVSNDGSWLAAGMDGVVLTLRASTGKVTRRFSSHTGGISAIAVSNDERLLAAADEFSTKLWNLDTGTLVHSFVGVTPALSTVFSPDGSWIATGGTDGLVRVWSIKSGMLAARLTGHASRVGSITVSQSGDLIASASDDRTVRIWDARPSSSPLPTQNETFRTFAYMKGEERLFAGGADGHIWVCTPPAADMRRAPLPQFGNIQAIALSPDDRQMAVAYFRGYIHQLSMIDLRSNSVGRTVFIGAAASSVSFGSRSRHLAVVGEDRLARIIDVEHGRTMLIPHKNINSAVFSPEGNILVLGSADSRIRVWDVSTWAVRLNLVGHRGCVRAMQFGPDGSWLVGGGEDGVTYVWSVGAGAVLARMAGHDGPVKSLSMSIDGRWIATSGADNTVRIWDTRTFTAVTAMRLNSSPDRLQFSSDGQFLAGIGAAGIYMLSFLPGLA